MCVRIGITIIWFIATPLYCYLVTWVTRLPSSKKQNRFSAVPTLRTHMHTIPTRVCVCSRVRVFVWVLRSSVWWLFVTEKHLCARQKYRLGDRRAQEYLSVTILYTSIRWKSFIIGWETPSRIEGAVSEKGWRRTNEICDEKNLHSFRL